MFAGRYPNVIGPPLGEGPLLERPADVLKIWPDREPVRRLRPAEFNPIIQELARTQPRGPGPRGPSLLFHPQGVIQRREQPADTSSKFCRRQLRLSGYPHPHGATRE